MSTDRRHRSPTIQLELPLDSARTRTVRTHPAEWRLDERTRRIGRQGIADARAMLGETTDAGRAKHPGDDRGQAGRAA